MKRLRRRLISGLKVKTQGARVVIFEGTGPQPKLFFEKNKDGHERFNVSQPQMQQVHGNLNAAAGKGDSAGTDTLPGNRAFSGGADEEAERHRTLPSFFRLIDDRAFVLCDVVVILHRGSRYVRRD